VHDAKIVQFDFSPQPGGGDNLGAVLSIHQDAISALAFAARGCASRCLQPFHAAFGDDCSAAALAARFAAARRWLAARMLAFAAVDRLPRPDAARTGPRLQGNRLMYRR
jgi:hypothetical protein